MSTDFDELAALDADNVMQTYGRLPVAFVRGEGTKLWDSEGKRVPRLPLRARGHVARPRASRGGRRDRRAGAHAAARVEPLLQRRAAAGRRAARTRCSAAAAGCSSPTPAPRPTSARSSSPAATARRNGGPDRYHVISAYGSFHGRTLTTLAATGQPQKQETFQPLPERVPAGRVRRSRRARRPRSTTASRRCCSKRCRARVAWCPRRPSTSRACAGCATSARRCSSSTRCSAASAAPARGSRSSTRASRPTSSRWRRRSATACRSARAGRGPMSRPRSRPATTRRRSAASRSRRAPRSRRSPSWSAKTFPTRGAARGRPPVGGACRRSTASPTCAAPGC